jgi:hypothetical protein
VDQQQQSRWRPTRRQLLWAAGGIAALMFLTIVVCGYILEWKWTGLPKRTFWDWLDLLIVPAAIAAVGTVGGAWFARQRAQETALQAYLDKMSELLIDKELHKREDRYDPTRVTARARTLVVLKQLNAGRKKNILQFLYEAQLINRESDACPDQPYFRARVGLDGADLMNANLRYITLSCAALDGTILENADLRDTNLSKIDLAGSYLSGADLRRADLSGARLVNAHLQRKDDPNLSGADLTDADLSGADLTGAAVTAEQLAQTKSLEVATMPDGKKYEDWLKDKEDC